MFSCRRKDPSLAAVYLPLLEGPAEAAARGFVFCVRTVAAGELTAGPTPMPAVAEKPEVQ